MTAAQIMGGSGRERAGGSEWGGAVGEGGVGVGEGGGAGGGGVGSESRVSGDEGYSAGWMDACNAGGEDQLLIGVRGGGGDSEGRSRRNESGSGWRRVGLVEE